MKFSKKNKLRKNSKRKKIKQKNKGGASTEGENVIRIPEPLTNSQRVSTIVSIPGITETVNGLMLSKELSIAGELAKYKIRIKLINNENNNNNKEKQKKLLHNMIFIDNNLDRIIRNLDLLPTKDEEEEKLEGFIYQTIEDYSKNMRLFLEILIPQIIILNQHVTEEKLRNSSRLFFNPDDSIKCWHLSSLTLHQLPELFGSLHISGNLDLSRNILSSLPESFGKIRVDGHLWLQINQLSSLPESFSSVTVGGNLMLGCNQLNSLPNSFGSIKVGENLFLGDNNLTSLPESFSLVTVGGNLELSDNKLLDQDIPKKFPNLVGKVI